MTIAIPSAYPAVSLTGKGPKRLPRCFRGMMAKCDRSGFRSSPASPLSSVWFEPRPPLRESGLEFRPVLVVHVGDRASSGRLLTAFWNVSVRIGSCADGLRDLFGGLVIGALH